jgi:hypothetical protein
MRRLAMRKVYAIVALVLASFFFLPIAAAAEKMKGTITQVDEKARTVTFSPEGSPQQQVLPVDKSVRLQDVKANVKAQLTVEAGVVKEIKAEGKKPPAAGY